MSRGKLVIIEGIDGSGKTTQIELLKQSLDTQVISFPRYEDNVYGKLIRKYLSGEFGELREVNPYLIALAYAEDRMLAKSQLKEWLTNGKLVLVNRYVSSSKAHLGANLPEEKRVEFFKWLDELEYQTNGLPKEDLTILLTVNPKVGQNNVAGRMSDLHEESLKHLEEANTIYWELAKANNWQVVNCMNDNQMRSAQDIHQEIIKILEQLPT